MSNQRERRLEGKSEILDPFEGLVAGFCEQFERRNFTGILRRLNRRIIGQEDFVTALLEQTMLNIRRMRLIARGADAWTLPRLAPIFVIGSTASGKSFAVETFFKELDIELVTINAASLTGASYYGNSLDDELSRIADKLVLPLKPIAILWDEFDKMVSANSSDSNPQAEILKYLEGDSYRGAYQHDPRRNDGTYFTLDTSLIINVFAGAFSGIEDTVRARLRSENVALGFASDPAARATFVLSTAELRERVTPADLESWGMLSELCGRLGSVLSIPALGEESLKRIVRDSENSLQARYGTLLPGRTKLVITDAAAGWLATYALDSKLGARALDHEVSALVAHANLQCLRDHCIDQVIIDQPRDTDGLALDICTSKGGLRTQRRIKEVHDRGG